MNKIMLIIGAFLLISTTWAKAQTQNSGEVDSILGQFNSIASLEERLFKISEIFKGLPYGTTGPLGEGSDAPYDQDPLYRFDTFDCTTFVETITALALSHTESEFIHHINQLRYKDGIIDYTLRNHFPSLDWIPNNTHNGYLEEINHLVLPEAQLSIANTIIDKPAYYNFLRITDLRIYDGSTEAEKALRVEELHREGDKFVAEEASVKYIPINTLVDRPALLKKIPHGAIVNFVRPNWDTRSLQGTRMNVSHQGFLFIKNNVLTLRHASSGDKFVVEVPFSQYLKKFYNHATLKGIHLMKVR